MSFDIKWKKSAVKELNKLNKIYIPNIISSIDKLAKDTFPKGVKKLSGSEFTYRIRVGDYRIIYSVIQKKLIIEIIRIRHRKDIYRKI